MIGAAKHIAPSPGINLTVIENGKVKDIIQAILNADQVSASFTKKFAGSLVGRNKRQTLKNIWSFVKNEIEYRRDEAGYEVIKSPGRTWKDRHGDCKSFSVFIGAILQNLGIKYKYRVAFYDPKTPEQGHIYPVALIGGKEIILDAVHNRFDEEVRYWKKKDYWPRRTGISGVGEAPKTAPWALLLIAAILLLR